MKKKLLAILFFALMVTLGVASVVAYIETHVSEGEDNIVVAPLVSSYAQQYPFDGKEVAAASGQGRFLDAVKSYASKVNYAVSGANIYTCNVNPLSALFSNAVSFLDRYDKEDG